MSEEKKKGRPPTYKDSFDEQAKVACTKGFTDQDLAELFGVTTTSIDNWKNQHPSFLGAIKTGKTIADQKVEKSLFERATGFTCKDTKFASFEGQITDSQQYDKNYPPDTTAAIFWLKNRMKDQWRDKTETDVNLSGKVDSTVDFADLPDED